MRMMLKGVYAYLYSTTFYVNPIKKFPYKYFPLMVTSSIQSSIPTKWPLKKFCYNSLRKMAITPSQINVDGADNVKQVEKDRSWYLPLYKAALRGDWESAKKFIDQDKDAVTAKITALSTTALHVVVGTGRAIHFVENLVHLMTPEALALRDDLGNTALNTAAVVGNTAAAAILVEKNPSLLHIRNNRDWLPVHRAALNAHKEILWYLLDIHKNEIEPGSLADQSGVQLLVSVIDSGFLDVALELVQRYPKLATMKLENGDFALNAIARKTSAFRSGSDLNFLQNFIYSCVPVKLENYPNNNIGGDIENPGDNTHLFLHMCGSIRQLGGKYCNSVRQKVHAMLWEVITFSIPHIKHIQNNKSMHHQALHLIESLCKEIKSLNDTSAYTSLYAKPILHAAKLGINEVVEYIVDAFPDAVYSQDEDNRYIFEVAVINRCENVFNLIYQTSEYKQYATLLIDNFGNTILHLAARLAPPHKLNLISGAALQMQRELQWFKEVENFVNPTYKEKKNSAIETPAMLFTKEHKKLVKKGEKWMKDVANSYMIAATLIATVVFSAAVTVPGGDNDKGIPFFSSHSAFIVFAIADAISLFTSTTSMLMFLSILTSRYEETDFLYVLPKRLVIGLSMLFVSTTTMMVAFSAALYLIFDRRTVWVLISLSVLACLPITSFVSLQFPLLVDVMYSTYGRGIFGKQSDRPFY